MCFSQNNCKANRIIPFSWNAYLLLPQSSSHCRLPPKLILPGSYPDQQDMSDTGVTGNFFNFFLRLKDWRLL